MGFRDLAKNLASSAIGSISGDLAVGVVYRQKTISVYNPVLDTYTTVNTDTPVKAVLVREKRDEDDNSKVIEDTVRVLIAGKSLSFVPAEQDEILINSVSHEIVQIKTDPAQALWILSARKP